MVWVSTRKFKNDKLIKKQNYVVRIINKLYNNNKYAYPGSLMKNMNILHAETAV